MKKAGTKSTKKARRKAKGRKLVKFSSCFFCIFASLRKPVLDFSVPSFSWRLGEIYPDFPVWT